MKIYDYFNIYGEEIIKRIFGYFPLIFTFILICGLLFYPYDE